MKEEGRAILKGAGRLSKGRHDQDKVHFKIGIYCHLIGNLPLNWEGANLVGTQTQLSIITQDKKKKSTVVVVS